MINEEMQIHVKKTKKKLYFSWGSIFLTLIIVPIIVYQVLSEGTSDQVSSIPYTNMIILSAIVTSLGVILSNLVFYSSLVFKLPDIILDKKTYSNIKDENRKYYMLLSKVQIYYLVVVFYLIDSMAGLGCIVSISLKDMTL